MRYFLFLHLFVCCLFSHAKFACAQSATEKTILQNQQLIHDYEQQRKFEEQHDFIEREKNALNESADHESMQQEKTGACIEINKINFTGTTLLSEYVIRNIRKNYEGQCLYLSDINDIMDKINEAYIDKGYISSRAYLPQQDLTNGTLTIQIVEGHLEGIHGENEQIFGTDKISNQLKTAFPNTIDQPLNIRDIEQGLDQINRLGSNNASMNMLPGNNTGGSVLNITNEKSKSWHIVTGIDNSGTESTGIFQGSIDASYDDLFGINDYINLTFKHDLDNSTRKDSRNVSLKYEVPYGYWTFSYGLNYFDYVSEVDGISQKFKTHGNSLNQTLSVNNVIHRNQTSKTTLNGSLVLKKNENYFADTKLDVSSRKLTIASISASHSRKIPNGFLFGNFSYSRGLKWMGAFENTPTSLDAQFDRFSVDANAVKLFDFGLEQYNPQLNILAHGVISPDNMFSSEQISIGGPYSVRGFKGESISGDNGGYVRLDLSTTLPSFNNASVDNTLGTLIPYVGFDIGTIKKDSETSNEGGTLKSVSCGLKNSNAPLSFEINYSRPISAPDYITKENEEFFMVVKMKF
jgi:hemolysin activation/secretion protein